MKTAVAIQYASKKMKDLTLSVLKNSSFWTVVMIAVVIYFIYSRGVKDTKDKALENVKDLPDSGQGIPENWKPQAKTIIDNFWNEFDGWSVFDYKRIEVMNQLLYLTDDQLTYCYNLYQLTYGNKDKLSLTEKLKAEYFGDYASGIRQKLIAKLYSLDLK